MFCVTDLSLDDFLRHYQAFSVVNISPPSTRFIMVNSLTIPNPMHMHRLGGKILITMLILMINILVKIWMWLENWYIIATCLFHLRVQYPLENFYCFSKPAVT